MDCCDASDEGREEEGCERELEEVAQRIEALVKVEQQGEIVKREELVPWRSLFISTSNSCNRNN